MFMSDKLNAFLNRKLKLMEEPQPGLDQQQGVGTLGGRIRLFLRMREGEEETRCEKAGYKHKQTQQQEEGKTVDETQWNKKTKNRERGMGWGT